MTTENTAVQTPEGAAIATAQAAKEAATQAKIAAKAKKLQEAADAKEAKAKEKAAKDEAKAAAKVKADEAAKLAKDAKDAAKAARAEAATTGATLGSLAERAKLSYVKGANGQLHNGDELGVALSAVPAKEIVDLIATEILNEPNKYTHLNYGQQSMNYRNRLRGAITKGLEVNGVKITLEHVVALAAAKVPKAQAPAA